MRNPENFDPQKIGRFSVVRVYYEYPYQRPEEKLFIVLRHSPGKHGPVCHCIKATSRTDRFEKDPELFKGVVLYPSNQIRFFYCRTVIDPASSIEIPHSLLKKEADRGRYRIEGVMPADFRARLVAAIKQSFVLEPKAKKHVMGCIDEAWP